MKRVTIILLCIALGFGIISCNSAKKETGDYTTTLDFKAEGLDAFAYILKDADSVKVFQINGDSAVTEVICGLSRSDNGISFKGDFAKDVPSVRFSAIPLRDIYQLPSEQRLVQGVIPPEACIISGITPEMETTPGDDVTIPVRFVCSSVCCRMTLSGIPQNERIHSLTITFPTDVTGTAEFNPNDASFTFSERGNVVRLSSDDGVGADSEIVFGITACTMLKAASVQIGIKTDKDKYAATYTIPQTMELKGNDTLSFEAVIEEAKWFNNPVITKTSVADPTIYREGRSFHMVATGLGQDWVGNNLVNWTSSGRDVISSDAKAKCRALGANFWAPDITEVDGHRMMYLTCYNSQTDCKIAVLRQNGPNGQFEYVGCLTDSNVTGIKDTIDAEVVTDPESGKVWLFFGSTGKVHRVELNSEGTALAAGARYEHVAGYDVNDNSKRDRVFEGTYLYYRDGWWYLFASAGQYWSYTYKIVVGRSRTIDGVFVDRLGRKMTDGRATDVISSGADDTFFGPGHNAEIFTDRRDNDYIMYHCHYSSIDNQSRFACLQRIFWDSEGWPYVEGGKPAASEIIPLF